MTNFKAAEPTLSRWTKQRQALYQVCHEMTKTGLVVGSSGNASMRLKSTEGDLVLITPMGRDLAKLDPSDLVVIDLEGNPVEEEIPPSSESALHLMAYQRRPDVGAVIHTHPIFATSAAVATDEIPPIIDELVIRIGGGIKVAKYAFPGTEELASNACEALDDRMAVLLRHHGLLTVGSSIEEAMENNLVVERLATIFFYASLLKEAKPLPPAIIKIEKEIYRMRREVEKANGGLHGIGT